jgi:hypothetical protein
MSNTGIRYVTDRGLKTYRIELLEVAYGVKVLIDGEPVLQFTNGDDYIDRYKAPPNSGLVNGRDGFVKVGEFDTDNGT